MNRKNHICTLNLATGGTPFSRAFSCPTNYRLAEGFARLQDLHFERNFQHNPLFGKSTEERIIWRELLELELQDLDEQLERILDSAGERSD